MAMNTIPVDVSDLQFEFSACTPKWVDGRVPEPEREQKKNRDGVNQWSVTVTAWDQVAKTSESIRVTVAAENDPCEGFAWRSDVLFTRLYAGTYGTNSGDGAFWWAAERVEQVGAKSRLSSTKTVEAS